MSIQPSQLDIRDLGRRTLGLCGVVDSHTAPVLLAALTPLGTDGDVTIDVAEIEFIDSSGLRTVITVHGSLADAGHKLLLRGESPSVDRLLEITGLVDHIHRV